MATKWWDDFEEIVERHKPLAPLTTYRIGGRASAFCAPRTTEETSALLSRLHEDGRPWRVLGGGANVLIQDGELQEVVIHTGSLKGRSEQGPLWSVGSGVSFLPLVSDAVRAGLAGLEVLAGIPGQMGGICAMNAGGRNGEICEVIREIEWVAADGEVRTMGPERIGFDYRRTALPPGIVTSVTLCLREGDPEELKLRRNEILQAKRENQPLSQASGGCIFANPAGHSAGRLIQDLGLKGRQVGDARVSSLHGNFIVNEGQARFADVLELIEYIERTVESERGVRLKREIKVWSDGVDSV